MRVGGIKIGASLASSGGKSSGNCHPPAQNRTTNGGSGGRPVAIGSMGGGKLAVEAEARRSPSSFVPPPSTGAMFVGRIGAPMGGGLRPAPVSVPLGQTRIEPLQADASIGLRLSPPLTRERETVDLRRRQRQRESKAAAFVLAGEVATNDRARLLFAGCRQATSTITTMAAAAASACRTAADRAAGQDTR